MKPSQKVGIENPETAKIITSRSIQAPLRHAASTPSGTPMPTLMSMANSVSHAVVPTRWPMRVVTGSPEKIGRAQVAAHDASEPEADLGEERLVEAELGADAGDVLARGVVAGDDDGRIPGVACRRAKTAMATTPMTGMVASKRRAISGNTRYAPFIRRAAAS